MPDIAKCRAYAPTNGPFKRRSPHGPRTGTRNRRVAAVLAMTWQTPEPGRLHPDDVALIVQGVVEALGGNVRLGEPAAPLLTPAQAAARLGVSRDHVYRMVAAGELPAVRLGSGAKAPIRIRPEDLEALTGRDAGEGAQPTPNRSAEPSNALMREGLVTEPLDLLPKGWLEALGEVT
jgi:excisionase family DNA binding protein